MHRSAKDIKTRSDMKIFIAISKKLAADRKNDRTNIGRIESFLFF
jgi:hypothetical protein